MKLFFNSSLPRSGSTLLQNIIAQNPDFYCTPTSGTLELLYGARANFSNDVTFKAQDQEIMLKGFQKFCHDGLKGFYSGITNKPFILEKSRGWGIHYKFLSFVLDEQPKIICMVRDLKQIIASLEIKLRNSLAIDPGIINHPDLKNTTTPKRVDYYLNSQPLGLAIERLSEIFRQGIHEHIKFIRYEDLCTAPEMVISEIYDYLETSRYQHHNFNFIEQKTKENDTLYGIFGDHTVTPKLIKKDNEPNSVLGKDVCDWIDRTYAWYNTIFKY